jgi:hypothetical protein
MKKKYYGIILLGEGIVGSVFLFTTISFPCFFKMIFKIPCPGCGLTRAFRAFIRLQFLEAFHYHPFSIPLFIFLILLNCFMIYDMWKGTDYLKRIMNKLYQHWFIFILIMGIAEGINLYKYFFHL